MFSDDTAAAGSEMRVSDAEREAAAAELQEHFASGRLNQDELNERLETAFAAKTRGDLRAIFADLPSSGHGWTSASSRVTGPFGQSEPFAQSGPFAAGADFRMHTCGGGWRSSARRSAGRFVAVSLMLWALFILGILGIFGIGAGRPLGILLLLAAFALLRRLLFMIFGWRLGRRGCRGPRRGPGPRRRR